MFKMMYFTLFTVVTLIFWTIYVLNYEFKIKL